MAQVWPVRTALSRAPLGVDVHHEQHMGIEYLLKRPHIAGLSRARRRRTHIDWQRRPQVLECLCEPVDVSGQRLSLYVHGLERRRV